MTRHFDEGRHHDLNWGLLGALGLCLEFWIIVTTAVTQNL
jgi:hypothetical protein